MAASCQTFLQVGLNAITASFIAPLVWGRLLTLELGMAAFFALALVCYARWRCGKKH
jgi:DHA1 family bicyclomycin/chloramphenicol resistance-like MFS transporter